MDFKSTWKIYYIIVHKDLNGNCTQYAREVQMLSTLILNIGLEGAFNLPRKF